MEGHGPFFEYIAGLGVGKTPELTEKKPELNAINMVISVRAAFH